MKKKIVIFLASLMMLTGCRTNGRQIGATFDTNVYKDYMTPDNLVDNLNYLMTNDDKDLSLLGNLIDGLVETDKYGNLKPAMAQDVGTPSSNYTVWDFAIRDDVPWVNALGEQTGQYVTADDFVCGIQYVLNQKDKSAYYGEVTELILNARDYAEGKVEFGAVGVKAISQYTVRFTLTESCTYFNTYLLNGGFHPVSRSLLNEMGDDFASSPAMMWYNGAYYLESFTNEKIVYKRNENYWEVGQISFESGTITLVENNEEALDLFKDGDLSYSFIDAKYAENNSNSIDSHMYMSSISPEVYAYLFNYDTKNEALSTAFKNENFRKAILNGMNVQAGSVTKEKEDGAAEETAESVVIGNTSSHQSTIIPSEFVTNSLGVDYLMLGSLKDISTKSNYDRAKSLDYASKAMTELAETVTFPIEIGVPICVDDDIELNEFNRITENFDSAFIVFKMLNYTKDTSNKDYPSFNRLISDNEYGMALVSILAENGDPSTYLSHFLSTDSVNNTYMDYKDEVYDALFNAADSIQASDARLMAFAECEAYLINKAVVIPFSHGKQTYKVSSINDYSLPRGSYGLARFKLKGVKATESAITINEREEFKAAYDEAKKSAA